MIRMYFAKAIKNKTANYPRMFSERDFFSKEWFIDKDYSVYMSFSVWLKQKFSDEVVDRDNFVFLNNTILVLTVNYPFDEETYFFHDGLLTKIFKDGKMNELFDEFNNQINN